MIRLFDAISSIAIGLFVLHFVGAVWYNVHHSKRSEQIKPNILLIVLALLGGTWLYINS